MRQLVSMWNKYKSVAEEIVFLHEQSRSDDPAEILLPLAYRYLQRKETIDHALVSSLGGYVVSKYPHLRDYLIGQQTNESMRVMHSTLEKLAEGEHETTL